MSKSSKQLPNCTKRPSNIHHYNRFKWCSMSYPCLYCSNFVPFTLHESCTRKALSSSLNNTEVYLTHILEFNITRLRIKVLESISDMCQMNCIPPVLSGTTIYLKYFEIGYKHL